MLDRTSKILFVRMTLGLSLCVAFHANTLGYSSLAIQRKVEGQIYRNSVHVCPLRDANPSVTGDDFTDLGANSTLKIIEEVQSLMESKYPAFYSLLRKNDKAIVANTIKNSVDGKGCTFFVPGSAAVEQLGEKRLMQLEDDRNLETIRKIGLYHIVANEAITVFRLKTEDWTVPKPKDGSPRPFTVNGIVTAGGEVPVGRSKSGGILGWGAKEDGDAVIGPNAKIVKSFKVGHVQIHETDGFISPQLLWRYMDQLRIPGF